MDRATQLSRLAIGGTPIDLSATQAAREGGSLGARNGVPRHDRTERSGARAPELETTRFFESLYRGEMGWLAVVGDARSRGALAIHTFGARNIASRAQRTRAMSQCPPGGTRKSSPDCDAKTRERGFGIRPDSGSHQKSLVDGMAWVARPAWSKAPPSIDTIWATRTSLTCGTHDTATIAAGVRGSVARIHRDAGRRVDACSKACGLHADRHGVRVPFPASSIADRERKHLVRRTRGDPCSQGQQRSASVRRLRTIALGVAARVRTARRPSGRCGARHAAFGWHRAVSNSRSDRFRAPVSRIAASAAERVRYRITSARVQVSSL